MPDTIEFTAAEDAMYTKAARECSRRAVQDTWAAGLPITILKGRQIVRIFPDGKEEVIKTLA